MNEQFLFLFALANLCTLRFEAVFRPVFLLISNNVNSLYTTFIGFVTYRGTETTFCATLIFPSNIKPNIRNEMKSRRRCTV